MARLLPMPLSLPRPQTTLASPRSSSIATSVLYVPTPSLPIPTSGHPTVAVSSEPSWPGHTTRQGTSAPPRQLRSPPAPSHSSGAFGTLCSPLSLRSGRCLCGSRPDSGKLSTSAFIPNIPKARLDKRGKPATIEMLVAHFGCQPLSLALRKVGFLFLYIAQPYVRPRVHSFPPAWRPRAHIGLFARFSRRLFGSNACRHSSQTAGNHRASGLYRIPTRCCVIGRERSFCGPLDSRAGAKEKE